MDCRENNEVKRLVHNLLGDYEKGRDIDTKEIFNQPDQGAVEALVKKLMRLIFPGYYRGDSTYKYYNM